MIFLLVIWEANVTSPELKRVSEMGLSSELCLGGPAWGCLAGELIFLVQLIEQALEQGAEPGSPAASHPCAFGQDLRAAKLW